MKIGILYICTGKYKIFWKDFYLSCEKNFINEAERHYFVFTDSLEIDFEKENPRIHKIYQKNLGWPNNTLQRFSIFLKIKEQLEKMDYVFFFNANLLFLKPISADEFLPTDKQKLIACIHPGYYNKPRKKFTYEHDPKSTAFISKLEGIHYFAGGLNGGKSYDFLEAAEIIKNNINADSKRKIIALWHDESHWNKYLANKDYIKVLQPGYLYPEGWSIPFTPIILVRNKEKYGGPYLLRDQKENIHFKTIIKKILPSTIINIAKKIIRREEPEN